ncbi:MAG: hypothetical protein J6S52_03190 [Prevotella sp.]|nr:hypothetical protein [Prevotella sp.]
MNLDLHNTMLLEEYRSDMPLYIMLRHVVMQQLENFVSEVDIELNQMESRIKSEPSLIGKLQRKGHKYTSLRDITDILGVRIIAYYNEDVDRMASMAEKYFDIDWANSVDKRKMHQFDSFGYNSLHYICRIPRSLYYDANHPEINEISFELQMRTALQHVWSDIQHDLGYKFSIETPQEYHRALSRLAGMLELADNEFSRIRAEIIAHRRRVTALMEQGRLEDIPLDGDTFTAYLQQHPFDKLNRYIASINNAELYAASSLIYLPVLQRLGFKTLADVEKMISDNYDDAYQLALAQLGPNDLDILSETIGIQNLCIVHIIKNGGGTAGLKKFFDTVNGEQESNAELAEMVMAQAKRLSFY